MRLRFFLLAVLTLAGTLAAGAQSNAQGNARPMPPPTPPQTPPIEELYRMPVVYSVPGMDRVTVRNEIVYKRVPREAGPLELKLDAYIPAGATADQRFPAVILISGGGAETQYDWRDGGAYISYGRLLAASSFVGISFSKRYARGPESAAMGEEDLRDLIRYVRDHAGELHVDPDRLAVWGYSAGGWLLSVPLRDPQPYVRAVVAYYAILESASDSAEARAAMQRFSSVEALRQNAARVPPILVARAGLDIPAINAGIDAFVREALAHNVEIEALNHAQGRHSFDILDDNERSREIIRATIEFLRAHLR